MHRLGTLLAMKSLPTWASVESCECRDYNTLMHSYVQICGNKELANIAGESLIQKYKKALSQKSYKDVFNAIQTFFDSCIQKKEGLSKKIFQYLDIKMAYEIDNFKKTLKQFGFTEDTKFDVLA